MGQSFVMSIRHPTVVVTCQYDPNSLDAKMAADKAKNRITKLVLAALASTPDPFCDQVQAVDAVLAKEQPLIPQVYVSLVEVVVTWPYGRTRQQISFVFRPTA